MDLVKYIYKTPPNFVHQMKQKSLNIRWLKFMMIILLIINKVTFQKKGSKWKKLW